MRFTFSSSYHQDTNLIFIERECTLVGRSKKKFLYGVVNITTFILKYGTWEWIWCSHGYDAHAFDTVGFCLAPLDYVHQLTMTKQLPFLLLPPRPKDLPRHSRGVWARGPSSTAWSGRCCLPVHPLADSRSRWLSPLPLCTSCVPSASTLLPTINIRQTVPWSTKIEKKNGETSRSRSANRHASPNSVNGSSCSGHEGPNRVDGAQGGDHHRPNRVSKSSRGGHGRERTVSHLVLHLVWKLIN
jgi:hypothetical protein